MPVAVTRGGILIGHIVAGFIITANRTAAFAKHRSGIILSRSFQHFGYRGLIVVTVRALDRREHIKHISILHLR